MHEIIHDVLILYTLCHQVKPSYLSNYLPLLSLPCKSPLERRASVWLLLRTHTVLAGFGSVVCMFKNMPEKLLEQLGQALGQLCESELPFYYVGPRNRTWVLRPGGKCCYLLTLHFFSVLGLGPFYKLTTRQ